MSTFVGLVSMVFLLLFAVSAKTETDYLYFLAGILFFLMFLVLPFKPFNALLFPALTIILFIVCSDKIRKLQVCISCLLLFAALIAAFCSPFWYMISLVSIEAYFSFEFLARWAKEKVATKNGKSICNSVLSGLSNLIKPYCL